ncbi:MAG TPA: imidazolonepropionase [Candidatus Acidoferrales bacterium]|nr:imidazolonepropionase [Candidatus Acidoferrales bacterium]
MPKKNADLIIHHAKQLITAKGYTQKPSAGPQMEDIGIIEDGAIAIASGKILQVGRTSSVLEEFSAPETIDATGKVVCPGFIDAHTHFVFAGSREKELELKIKGAGYLEILRSGGGILSTVRDTRTASKDELLRICRKRATNLLIHGTTTIEAKSGYGLELEAEVKLLEVIAQLSREGPLQLVPTFLGAHAIPSEFDGRVHEYVDLLCAGWIPIIAEKHLATFCDVFCEKGVFEIDDSRKILLTGKRFGLLPRIHADELYALGGAELAAEVGAVSADHLLYATPSGFEQMKRAGVIATLLPAAPLTLMLDRYADARNFISHGIPVALGSDLSPSCWLENEQLVLALACYKLKMTPAEAVMAATINAAHSIRMSEQVGSLETGKRADAIILNVPDYRILGYRLGVNLVDVVVKSGRIVVRDGGLA